MSAVEARTSTRCCQRTERIGWRFAAGLEPEKRLVQQVDLGNAHAHNDMDDGDTTHHRGDFLLFGHGFTCTTPVEHEIQGAVWEAALRTTNWLLTGLRVDATDFDTTDACTRATTVLRRLVQVDYHAATTRSGHPDRPQSVRAFATKWRGLVLTKRRTMDCLF